MTQAVKSAARKCVGKIRRRRLFRSVRKRPGGGPQLAPRRRSPDNGCFPCRRGRLPRPSGRLWPSFRAACTGLNMKIEKDRVVSFHYTVSEVGQAPIESSKDRDPLVILIGHGKVKGIEMVAAVPSAFMSLSVLSMVSASFWWSSSFFNAK